MALTTLSQLKAFLNVTDSSKDAWLEALRGAAEADIKLYCNQNFEQTTQTEYYTGNGQRVLVLRQRPVQSITSVFYDSYGNFGTSPGAFDSTTLLTAGTHYCLDLDQGSSLSSSGILFRINTVWAELGRIYTPGKLYAEQISNAGNLKITYISGYATIPQDLQYAVALLVAYMKLTAPIGGFPLEAERLGDYSYKIHFPVRLSEYTKPEIGQIRQILQRYRDCPI